MANLLQVGLHSSRHLIKRLAQQGNFPSAGKAGPHTQVAVRHVRGYLAQAFDAFGDRSAQPIGDAGQQY